jgi:hypothetical protein
MQGLIDLAQRGTDINVNLELPGIVALVAGILILVMPRILNYIVAAYLIIVGLIMLFDIRI